MNLEDFDCDSVMAMLCEVEDVAMLENFLDERHLSLGVLPSAVEHVHGERCLESLDLKSQLQGLDQQDQARSVADNEAGMIKLVDDLFPVEVGMQLVQDFDEDLQIPSLHFVASLFFVSPQGCPGRVEILQLSC